MSTDRVAVQSWALNRTLTQGEDPMDLLALPGELERRGYGSVQLCHFHLPRRGQEYLLEMRGALAESGIRLDALLIDDGDLTDPDEGDAAERWVAEWISDAAVLGADRVRVIAGKTRTVDSLQVSSERLGRLAANPQGVRVVTENWFDVTASAGDVEAILDPLEGRVGLLIDLANWTGATKYDELARLARYGETCHAKAEWHGDTVDETDFRASIAALEDNGYTGPYALVYSGQSPDEWAGLEVLRAMVVSETGRRSAV